jgi:hypothetical protein
MTRIVLVYGLLSGLIIVGVIVVGMVLSGGQHTHSSSVWLGYLVMLLGLSMIFLGVKQYRDNALGGVIKFGPALGLGLAIAVVAGLAYVIVWEVYSAATNYEFAENYAAAMIETKRAQGLSGEALQKEIAKAQEFVAQYRNPLFRMPMTFIEIFPVGLLIALISAGLLRNPKLLPKRSPA